MNVSFLAESCIKVAISVIAGLILGLERKTHHQVVGTRTLIIISVSSTLLAILSIYLSDTNLSGLNTGGDPTRITSCIVSGIGFLGGGAIMKQGLNIKGLTSAAVIWCAAAIGMSIGSGLYIPSFFVLIVSVVILVGLEKLEQKIFPAGKSKTLHLNFNSDNIDFKKVERAIKSSGLIISDFNMNQIISKNQIILHYSVKSPKEDDYSSLVKKLQELGELSEFSITD